MRSSNTRLNVDSMIFVLRYHSNMLKRKPLFSAYEQCTSRIVRFQDYDNHRVRWKYDTSKNICHDTLQLESSTSLHPPCSFCFEDNINKSGREFCVFCLHVSTKMNSNSNCLTGPQIAQPKHVLITKWSWDSASEVWQFLTRLSGRRRSFTVRTLISYGGSLWMRITSFLYLIIIVTLCLPYYVVAPDETLPLLDIKPAKVEGRAGKMIGRKSENETSYRKTASTHGCSSRSTPKPKQPHPTLRPNITIQTYTCPFEYDAHYCLNGATCFTVKIGESILYNCDSNLRCTLRADIPTFEELVYDCWVGVGNCLKCSEGYMGQRCEFKDLDGSYLPSKQRALLEQAGITSGVVIVVIALVILFIFLYIRPRQKAKDDGNHINTCPSDEIDNQVGYKVEKVRMPSTKRPFSSA